MTEHINARGGLRNVFIAQILLLLGSCMNFVAPNVDTGAQELTLGAWAVMVFSIFAFAALIIEIIGFSKAAKDAEGYKKAFRICVIALVVSIALSLLDRVLPNSVSAIMNTVLSNILRIIAAYYMMTTSLKFLAENGEKDIVALGSRLWIAYIVGSLLLIISSVLSALIKDASVILAYICGVCGVVRCLALAVFLAKAYKKV